MDIELMLLCGWAQAVGMQTIIIIEKIVNIGSDIF